MFSIDGPSVRSVDGRTGPALLVDQRTLDTEVDTDMNIRGSDVELASEDQPATR